MRLRVRLFAVARQLAEGPEIDLDVPDGGTVLDLRHALGAASPPLAPILPRCMVAVDSEYADDSRTIPPGAEVAIIPPVSGGLDG